MSAQILEETRFFLYSIMTGAWISVIYDIIRIFRRVVKHNKVLVALEDILFWVVSLVILFLLLYDMNYGVLRWFSVAGEILGMIIYKKILGEHLVDCMSTILKRILDVVTRLILLALKPFFAVKKKLTDALKFVKITLCKRNKQTGDIVRKHNES